MNGLIELMRFFASLIVVLRHGKYFNTKWNDKIVPKRRTCC